MSKRKKKTNTKKRNEIYRIRYQIYRDLGYSPKDARALRSRSPYKLKEIEKTEIDERTKKEKKVVDYEVKNIKKVEFTDIIKINKKTGKVVKNQAYYNVKNSMTGPKDLTNYVKDAWNVKEETVYKINIGTTGAWGVLTQHEPYRDRTVKMVKFLQKEHKLNEDQAYYMLYYITTHKINYADARQELLSNQEFEMYIPKRKRNSKRKRGKR